MKTLILALLAGAAIGGATWAGAQQRSAPELAYQVTEGQNLNAFLRDGPVAGRHFSLRCHWSLPLGRVVKVGPSNERSYLVVTA